MAVTVQLPGLATVKVFTTAGAEVETLGYTRNGVEITYEGFYDNIPGDENGGDAGPPVDIQYLGEIARVRCEFTKWDSTVASKLECHVPILATGAPSNPGNPTTAGTAMFAGSKAIRLLIHSATSLPRNFPRAFPRAAIETNRGTKFATFTIEFECHKDANGILWNTSTT